jgi:CrcB protein
MNRFIVLAIGGSVGAIARYVLAGQVQLWLGGGFPYGTLVVNLLGCLILGVLAGLAEKGLGLSETIRLLLITGFLGSLTTFSTMEYESLMLLKAAESGKTILYLSISILLGLLLMQLAIIATRAAIGCLRPL